MQIFSNKVNGKKLALVSDCNEFVTYSDLMNDAKKATSYINNRFLVIILCDNSIQTIRTYSALAYSKCVPLLLNADVSKEHLDNYIRLYHPKYVWIPLTRKNELSISGNTVYESDKHTLIETIYSDIVLHDKLAILLTTSGSTGNPKVVRISEMNILENTDAIIDTLQLNQDDIGVTTLPMNYTYGMAICNMHLMAGSTLLVTSKKVINPAFLDFIKKKRITNIQGVPFVHEMLDRVGFYDNVPEQLKLITMGGGKARKELQNKINSICNKNSIRFCAVYGQTEGTTMLTKLPDGCSMNETGTIGVACKGMTAQIEPETNELIFCGSSVSLGYANNYKDLQKGDENKGILHTGDVAYIDSDKRIYLLGRINRYIKIAGIRVNLDDIENIIQTNVPKVDCACCGNDNDMHIYIDQEGLESKIKNLIFEKTKLSTVMISVRFVSEISRNQNGKIDYEVIEKTYENSYSNS